MELFYVPVSLLAGGLLAVQAGANAQLSKTTGSPVAATTLQLLVGAIVLLLVALVTGTLIALSELPKVPWWHAVGGTASAFYVISTILLFPRLGAVVSVGLFIAGQMLASLLLDGTGLLGVTPRALGLPALTGISAALAGAAATVLGQRGAMGELSPSKLGWILLALLAGSALPVQGAINGLLRADIGAPFAVGAVSFVVATVTMAGIMLLGLALTRRPRPQMRSLSQVPWWGWLGGFAGAIYVTTVFTAIPVIGTAAAIGLTIAGQQIASLFVDRYGWFRLPQRPISGLRLAGVAALLVGVALIQAH